MKEFVTRLRGSRARVLLLGVLVLLSTLVIVGAWFDYRSRQAHFRRDALAVLEAVAAEKANVLELWRSERLSNAEAASGAVARAWPAETGVTDLTSRARARVLAELAGRCQPYGYRQAWLLGAEQEPPLVADRTGEVPPLGLPGQLVERASRVLAPALLAGASASAEERRAVVVAAPVLEESTGERRGTLVLVSDVESRLVPIVGVGSRERLLGKVLLFAREPGFEGVVVVGRRDGSETGVRSPVVAGQSEAEHSERIGREPRGAEEWSVSKRVGKSTWQVRVELDPEALVSAIRQLRVQLARAYFPLMIAVWSTSLLLWTRSSRERERRRRGAAEQFREFFEQAGDGIFVTDSRLILQDANPAACRLVGYSREELVGRSAQRLLQPDELKARPVRVDDASGERPLRRERTLVHRDGRVVPVELGVQVLADGRLLGFVRDISERRRSEEWLRLLSRALDESPAANVITDRSGRIEYVNQRFSEITGWAAREAVGETPRILSSGHTSKVVYGDLWSKVLAGRAWRGEMVNRRKSGELYHWLLHIHPLMDADGAVSHLIGVGEDITEQRRYRERFRLARELAQLGVWELDLRRRDLWCSEETLAILGLAEDAARPSLAGLLDRVRAEDRPRLELAIERAATEREPFDLEFRFTRADGAERIARGVCEPQAPDEVEPLTLLGVVLDVTDQRASERALAETRDQLLQAQKMDALGRLAGGVAHDFNNLLSIVLGYSDLLAPRFPDGSEERQQIEEVRGAVGRASDLTRQLLAFSRRQVLDMRVVEPGEVLLQTQKLLRRVMPESIDFALVRAPDLWRVRADPAQLVQVLINLSVNARDAMPKGGRLEIMARNEVLSGADAIREKLAPGEYLRIDVQDTGVGMAAEVAARAFEPFFTTKGEQGGTGLGLATVYGIVQQLGGDIRVQSALEAGSRFVLRLPRARREESGEVQVPAGEAPEVPGTVLVVEDMAPLRKMLRRMLEGLGYGVLSAASADEALAVAAGHAGAIDILLSDIVMPGLDGRELAKRLRAERPALAIILMSGYSDLLAEAGSAAELGADAVLQKPFTSVQLRRLLGEVRARPASPPSA